MTKNHLKRIPSPKSWDIMKKENKFIIRPFAGSTSFKKGFALGTLLRDYLKYAKSAKEAKYILNNKEVLVNKIKRKDIHDTIGLMDIVEIPSMNKSFRILLTKKGKLELLELNESEKNLGIFKILNKKIIKKGKIQLNLSGSKNILVKDKKYRLGDSITLDLSAKKIKDHFKLEKSSMVYLTGGKHVAESGIIDKIGNNQLIFKTKDGRSLETSKNHAFVIGKEKSAITLFEK
ncbi:30S ribosomal protein S4e [Candidatus Woesearchaeota archaeon]|nr:30S ribosomal protein S4e [Candidatus Woesearchaeota archaeon]